MRDDDAVVAARQGGCGWVGDGRERRDLRGGHVGQALPGAGGETFANLHGVGAARLRGEKNLHAAIGEAEGPINVEEARGMAGIGAGDVLVEVGEAVGVGSGSVCAGRRREGAKANQLAAFPGGPLR